MTDGSVGGEDAVVVGVVGKPFGVHGACYVRPDADVDHDFPAGARYRTGPEAADVLEVVRRHDHGRRTVVTFAGIDTRADAERIRGTVLRVERTDAMLPDESLWAADIVGAEVLDVAGVTVGRVTALADGPAHDYLIVTTHGGRHVMVPAVEELVDIQPAGASDPTVSSTRVVVQPLPGLLDPQLADPELAEDQAADHAGAADGAGAPRDTDD